MEIRKYYEKIAKELPSFDSFNCEFEIEDIEKGNFALHIASRIVDKTEKFRKILEEYLHADGSSIAILMEIKGMNEKDKEKINQAYQELILIERALCIAEIDNNEQQLIDFIHNSIKKWNEIKPILKEILSKARDSWKNEVKIQEHLGYLG